MNIHDIEVLLILGRIYRFLQAIHWFVISVKYVQPPQSTRVPIVQNMIFGNENTFFKERHHAYEIPDKMDDRYLKP